MLSIPKQSTFDSKSLFNFNIQMKICVYVRERDGKPGINRQKKMSKSYLFPSLPWGVDNILILCWLLTFFPLPAEVL